MKIKVILTITIEYAWICKSFEYASGPKPAKTLNMAKFWMPQSGWIYDNRQVSEYAKVLNVSNTIDSKR